MPHPFSAAAKRLQKLLVNSFPKFTINFLHNLLSSMLKLGVSIMDNVSMKCCWTIAGAYERRETSVHSYISELQGGTFCNVVKLHHNLSVVQETPAELSSCEPGHHYFVCMWCCIPSTVFWKQEKCHVM